VSSAASTSKREPEKGPKDGEANLQVADGLGLGDVVRGVPLLLLALDHTNQKQHLSDYVGRHCRMRME
jgi:hypothetical protein